MRRRDFYIGVLVAAILGGIISIGGYSLLRTNDRPYNSISEHQSQLALTSLTKPSPTAVPDGLNFIEAANASTTKVVHIRSIYSTHSAGSSIFRYPQSQSTGSGVIVSNDGYIATNNHVVADAKKVEVVLHDNRKFTAEVIGTDPTTDLALIKINERNLPYMEYGNSDDIQIGEWVLAVGNPFNLTSTVTAGIVSAKARNIGILQQENRLQVESFIQTDAVVNPGNSGGALVDLNGRLIGINTAIASRSGSYEGYSFAVPVTLAKKVLDDLLEFGVVQRGLLGITIQDVNADLAERLDLDIVNGVYVATVNSNSGAEAAGIEPGDVIIGIDGKTVDNISQLQELVARNRPGDEVAVEYLRNGDKNVVMATLKNTNGNTMAVVSPATIELEGAKFRNIDALERSRLGIEGGVRLTDIDDGVWEESGLKKGFIITEIDKSDVGSVEEFEQILNRKQGEKILVLGVMPNGSKSYFSVDW